ncbi:MAG TPA: hypothetical protein VGR14_19645 [Verrucomicrobiae bacterium]|jgi:hypothetical protein|nr:hypothetical protein [Verrucomicrobiae bacterium]
MPAMNQRPLAGLCLGISISGGEDLATKYGLSASDLSAITVELCRRFVGLGSQVALGHQWRPKGIMEEVVRFARVYQWEVPSRDGPIIHNFLAWPDRAALSDSDRKELNGLVHIDEPKETPPVMPGLPQRAAALTAMRQRVNDLCASRICLSGKVCQPNPLFVSGVLEEASLMIKRSGPVFMSGMMGGVASLLIERLRGKQVAEQEFGGDPNRTRKLWEAFRPEQKSRLAELSGLTNAEQDELFDAQNLDTIVKLVARGMRTIKERRSAPALLRS